MVAMTLFGRYDNSTRIKYVKDYYDAISQFYISLPTPIMAGVRTPTRQFSSCVLIESGDSLDSINATSTSIVKYISNPNVYKTHTQCIKRVCGESLTTKYNL